ncbi:MAG: N-acetylmuramoyl-L-alanine amidase family protein [Clostridium beijerinckii]|jgi:glucan-binding YG repeat protein|nr:N-acetylmuramoyl-L-alanine amidase family protein [Clostridium beijerinckii]MCI1577477.1 N-acetylmuramoyl-L-alanine amidase family protein [Clostridium beijerinckii]MCI1583250.1 N-acetylmuramoyl-L-alanine amidase family protein [Clostridium beijerinckii]MCI1621150.1 N-acetylmuramoyl-L-alanine amidase family protein [Clostridium beijerinckii]
MFKRANKITALLVAAASVMAVVPAMAADKLGTKDGTIEKAIAYKDGKYLYEGYRTDDDDKGLYYNSGDKDKKLDDATAFATFDSTHPTVKFDDKYVMAEDGNDDYVVDISTGKVSDEDNADDLRDTAQTKLINKLKKTDRYIKDNANLVVNTKKIDNGRFDDVWYEYTATTASGATALTGYTNASGAYIDCSKDANIYVFNGTKMIKVDSFGDTETDSTGSVTIGLPKNVKTLGQDDKYIYRLIDVDVVGAHKVKPVDASNAAGTDFPAGTVTLTYIQKISKTQGDKEKDAYLPKSTDSYELSLYTGNGDARDAVSAIAHMSDTGAQVRIVDGAIYVTYTNDDKVKTEKVVLKTSEKLDLWTSATTKSSDKVDGHVAKKDGDKDTKIETENSSNSWTTDVKGNVWAIQDGEVKKSEKLGDFKTMYTVDRSMNSIDVYDDNNLIVWDKNGDVYTTVSEGKKQAEDDASQIVQPTPAKVGWDKLADGSWNFYDATGAKVTNNWANVGGAWYFLKADGVMATGWQQVGGVWYYLTGSGAMATGWINDGANWYYLNASGAMLANTTTPDGYYVGPSGAWVK